jgi:hypothetical protein
MLWLGGMFFLGVVGGPVLRAVEPAALRQQLFQQLGLRFRSIGWSAIGVLVLTGVGNLHYRGWLHWGGVLASGDFWRSAAGHALALKLGWAGDLDSIEALKALAKDVRGSLPSGVIALGLDAEEPQLFVTVSDDLVSRGLEAGAMVQGAVAAIDGRGGGRPGMAQGKGSRREGLGDAIVAVRAAAARASNP